VTSTQSENPSITPAQHADLPALARLAAQTLREAWSEQGFAAIQRGPGGLCLVARSPDGSLAGFLLAQCVLDELHVLSLAVDESARRRGLGTALLEAGLATAAASSVLLEVRRSNAAARAFYGSRGFEEVGCRSRYYPDGEDALLLTRFAPGALLANAAAGGHQG
jgi:ribosomal-protein-alanine N-acetyltransferase